MNITMKYLSIASCGLCLAAVAQASVFPSSSSSSYGRGCTFGAGGRLSRRQGGMLSSSLPFSSLSIAEERRQAASQIRRKMMNPAGAASAMAIPGYGLGEQIFVGGFQNFLQAYNLIITGRILLSWFPQAQGIGVLQPIFAITDPYLNLFRGLIPPIFGLDLSPLLAFFLLNTLGTATTALGADLPSLSGKDKKSLTEKSSTEQQQFLSSRYAPFPVRYFARKSATSPLARNNNNQQENPCMNY